MFPWERKHAGCFGLHSGIYLIGIHALSPFPAPFSFGDFGDLRPAQLPNSITSLRQARGNFRPATKADISLLIAIDLSHSVCYPRLAGPQRGGRLPSAFEPHLQS